MIKMGSRISWCTKDKSGRMPIYLREQWKSSVKGSIEGAFAHLTDEFNTRDDLDTGRVMNALVCSINAPHQDLTPEVWDSSDNGLIEIDVSNPEIWVINHYDIDFQEQNETNKTHIATLTKKDGFQFEITDREIEEMGEGMF